MQTFTWCPLIEPEGSVKFRTHEAQFGDGYKQSAGDGINNKIQSWPLSFRGKESYIEEIKNFLDDHKGFMPFKWKPPLGSEALFSANEYSLIPLGGKLYTLTVTFEQRFEP